MAFQVDPSTIPPFFGREAVPALFPGVITHGYLKNLDSRGEGPKRFRLGRKVVYRREDFLAWLQGRAVELA